MKLLHEWFKQALDYIVIGNSHDKWCRWRSSSDVPYLMIRNSGHMPNSHQHTYQQTYTFACMRGDVLQRCKANLGCGHVTEFIIIWGIADKLQWHNLLSRLFIIISGGYSPSEWWKVCAFYHTSMKFCTKMHLDVFFHIEVRGKFNYFNMAFNFKITAIDPFEGLYALVMRACINHWSLNNAYYAAEERLSMRKYRNKKIQQ